MIAIALLSACSTGPSVTTESTFVGRLVDRDGEPGGGVEVNSIEGKHQTDGDGRFAVPVKAPSKLVHFFVDDVYYQRLQRDKDVGTSAEVVLPTRAPRVLQCPPMECDVSLGWRFESALTAKHTPSCTPGATLQLSAMPTQIPQGTCRTGQGRDRVLTPLAVDETAPGTWTLREAGADVTVEVLDADGARKVDCEVTVGSDAATLQGDGTYVGRAHGKTTVSARCAGRAARPASVDPDVEQPFVTLDWAAEGPSVDLGAVAPEARFVVLRNQATGWELSTELEDGGVLDLPTLAPGQYVVYMREPRAKVPTNPPEPINVTDVLSFVEVSDGSWVGRMRLEEELTRGRLRTHVAPKR